MDCEGKILLIDFISPNPDNCVRVLWGAEEGRRREGDTRLGVQLRRSLISLTLIMPGALTPQPFFGFY